jgi:hypothetical protein
MRTADVYKNIHALAENIHVLVVLSLSHLPARALGCILTTAKLARHLNLVRERAHCPVQGKIGGHDKRKISRRR